MSNPETAIQVATASGLVVIVIGGLARRQLLGNCRPLVRLDGPMAAASERGAALPVRSAKAMFLRLGRRSRISLAAVAISTGVLLLGPLPILILLISGLSVVRGRPLLQIRRHRRDIERQLPNTIELLVLSIHAGLTPNQAIREVAHSAPEATRPAFVEVVHRLDRGEPLTDALVALPEMLGSRAVGFAEATGSASRYGLPLGQVLEQLSSEARSTRRRLDEANARKLPVRLSFPLVVCTLPSFVLLAIAPAVIAALSSLGTSAP